MPPRKTPKVPAEIVRASELIQERLVKLNGTDDGRREAFIETQALLLQAVLEVSGGE